MRLNISVANAQGVDVEKTSEGLVSEEFDLHGRESLLMRLDVRVKITLVILHDNIEVLTVLFHRRKSTQNSHCELSL